MPVDNEFTLQDDLGAAISPEAWAQFVLDHLTHESVLLASGARRIDTSAKQIHIARVQDDGGTAWLDELEDISTDKPEGDDLVLTPRKIGALTVLSNESVGDSSPAALDVVGTSMLRAVALEVDRAGFHGEGDKAPVGFLDDPAVELPGQEGDVTYENIVRATGKVRAAGGRPDTVYVNPIDLTELQLATDGEDRPLLGGDARQGAPATVAGVSIWPTPALDLGEAVVAQADNIIVAVRRDASVAFSTDAKFSADGTVARVIARVDYGVNDPDALCVIGGGS